MLYSSLLYSGHLRVLSSCCLVLEQKKGTQRWQIMCLILLILHALPRKFFGSSYRYAAYLWKVDPYILFQRRLLSSWLRIPLVPSTPYSPTGSRSKMVQWFYTPTFVLKVEKNLFKREWEGPKREYWELSTSAFFHLALS